jgi:hypothetical protein
VNPLVQAIDALLAYVEDHWQTPDYGDRLEQFEVLDTAVYVEARRLGLHDADMPRRDATFHSDEVVFFGRTNVPGCWSSPPDAPSTLLLMVTQGWKAGMETLRKLALQSEPGKPDAKGGQTTERTPESPDLKLNLAPGGFTWGGKPHQLVGKPLDMLRVLLDSPHFCETANRLRQRMGVDDEGVTFPEQVIKDTAHKLRKELKKAAKAAGRTCPSNPLPSTGRGKDLTYRLNLS